MNMRQIANCSFHGCLLNIHCAFTTPKNRASNLKMSSLGKCLSNWQNFGADYILVSFFVGTKMLLDWFYKLFSCLAIFKLKSKIADIFCPRTSLKILQFQKKRRESMWTYFDLFKKILFFRIYILFKAIENNILRFCERW